MMNESKNIDEMTFKEALDQLEGIVNLLEGGTLELEESLEMYSKGVKLLALLQKKLNGAEQKVEVLMGELEKELDDEAQDTTLSKA